MSVELTKAKTQARRVIQMTQKALKKHIRLIKRRERISSVVAMTERLRSDLEGADVKAIRAHILKLNELTKGFADFALKTGKRVKP